LHLQHRPYEMHSTGPSAKFYFSSLNINKILKYWNIEISKYRNKLVTKFHPSKTSIYQFTSSMPQRETWTAKVSKIRHMFAKCMNGWTTLSQETYSCACLSAFTSLRFDQTLSHNSMTTMERYSRWTTKSQKVHKCGKDQYKDKKTCLKTNKTSEWEKENELWNREFVKSKK
jgi:hypothetical protein